MASSDNYWGPEGNGTRLLTLLKLRTALRFMGYQRLGLSNLMPLRYELAHEIEKLTGRVEETL